jgi:chemotaxis protein histidine kinase CheA
MPSISESCPLCGTELSKTKFVEIQTKIQEQEQQKLSEQTKRVAEAEAAVRQRLQEDFKRKLQTEKEAAAKLAKQEAEQQIKKITDQRDDAAKKQKEAEMREAASRKQAERDKETAAKLAKQEAEQQIKKIADERDDAAKKLKEVEVREAAFRKQAEKEKEAAAKSARQQAEEQIKKMATERDQANKKLKEAEARQAEIRKQVQEEAEQKRQKELADQRIALEKDKAMTLLRQNAEFNREREKLQKKVKLMEHQLEKKTANELGDGGEIDLFEALREAFPADHITRIKKGQPGADILHEVCHKGQSCGRIIIDSKNHQGWQNGFVAKLRQDQLDAGADHGILATTAFPAGKKEMCIESDIIVINPARVVHISQILRQAMLTMHIRGLSIKERAGKMNRLYKLITSEAYGRKFSEAGKLTLEILDLDVQEKKAHDNVWKKRGTVATRINHVLREIETEVAAVIEGDDEIDAADGYTVQSTKMAPTAVALGEVAAWKKL